MDTEEIKSEIEDLAANLVMAGPQDLPALAQAHTAFQGIGGALGETQPYLALVVNAAGALVEKVIMSEVDDPEAAMGTLHKTIEALQLVYRDGRSPQDLSILEELSTELDVENSDADAPPAETKEEDEPEPEVTAKTDDDAAADDVENDETTMDTSEFTDRFTPLFHGLTGILQDFADDQDAEKVREVFDELAEKADELGLSQTQELAVAAAKAIDNAGLTRSRTLLIAACEWFSRKLASLDGSQAPPPPPEQLVQDLSTFKDKPTSEPVETADELEEVELFEETDACFQDVDMIHDFIDEATEHLESADEHLLALESNADDHEALNAVFRAFHTIKGVAGFLELRNIQMMAHEAENMLDLMRKPHITVTPTSLDLAFESIDHLKQLMNRLAGAMQTQIPPEPPASMAALIPKLRRELEVLEGKRPSSVRPAPTTSNGGKTIQDPDSVQIFIPDVRERLDENDTALMTLEKSPHDAEAINAVFRAFHTIKGEAAFLELTDIQHLAHETESLLEDFRDEPEAEMPPAAIDLIFESNDLLKAMIGELETALSGDGVIPPPPDKMADLVQRIQTQVQQLTGKAPQAPAPKQENEAPVPAAKEKAQPDKPLTAAKAVAGTKAVREALKVDAQRLDLLIDTIGELVIAEAMVNQSEELRNNRSPELRTHLNHLNKITRELQQIGMGLRMVTVRGTFNRMARVVRDLTKKIGKDVEFITEGEDTELDKTVVDAIGDPLLHMIRNAVDHGLEDPETRVAAGKPAKGRVELRAYHKGGNIYIAVIDDGRGLNQEAILKKAVERNIIREEDIPNMADRQIFNLVFAPGFSTAESVTNVSGRGVGMDVVKRNIESLRGAVEIQSEPGRGSTFLIRLPLTLAIIDGMLTGIGKERYVVPTLSIIRTIQPGSDEIKTVLKKGEMLESDGRLIPLFRLGRLFNIENAIDDPHKALIVVVESDGQQAGIMTDELLGQQQIVIKSLGKSLQGLLGISGGAILADGQVGLIIDVGTLVKLAHSGQSPTQVKHVIGADEISAGESPMTKPEGVEETEGTKA